MDVHVDEAGRDDLSRGIETNGIVIRQAGANGFNPAVADQNIRLAIAAGRRVDHPAARD
jgi:hypothetical protein